MTSRRTHRHRPPSTGGGPAQGRSYEADDARQRIDGPATHGSATACGQCASKYRRNRQRPTSRASDDNDNPGPKATRRLGFTRNHNASGFDSNNCQRQEAAHVRTNSVLRDRASAPIANRLSPIAVEARPPVLRACAGRLVAPDRSTAHRTSAPARSTGAADGVRRPGYLRRDQVGARIIAYGVSGPQHHSRGLQPPPRPTHCR